MGLLLAALCRAGAHRRDGLAAGVERCRTKLRGRASPLAAVALLLVLTGCSAAPFIDLYAADYRTTQANAGDSQLLVNILRARDNLPIHFADLSIIHGSIQLTATAAPILPYAHLSPVQTVPSQFNPTLTAQSSPTFDLGTLDTQEFTKGMLSPIDPQIIKQLFDQGVDPRIIMLLFFSEYQNPSKQRFMNNMACDLNNPGRRPELGCYSNVYDYLGQIDHFFKRFTSNKATEEIGRRQLQANVYVVLTPLGGRLAGSFTAKESIGDLSGLDPKKVKLVGNQLYSISEPQLAICYYEKDHTLHALLPSRLGDATCNEREIKVTQPERPNAGLSVRSTYEILQFLGQVLRFQQETVEPNRCITLSDNDGRCDAGEVLFQVNAPVGTPAVGTRYGGAWYAINDRSCNRLFNEPCDYSLQVLAIVELLLNANKAASDIPSTPRVQVVR